MGTTQGLLYQLGGVPVGTGLGNIGLCGGKVYFCDPTNGLAGGDALTPETANSSLETCYGYLRDGKHDTIVMIPGATRNTLVAAITWSKSYCHLFGAGLPLALGHRSGILGSAASDLATLITVSGSGNSFHNLKFTNEKDSDAAQGGVYVTGERNFFENCEIVGVCHATPGARTTDIYDLKLSGDGENTFVDCSIGADTFARSAASSVVRFASAANRNVFTGCRFVMYATAATPLFCYAGASGVLDRYTLFNQCKFVNDGPYSAGSAIDEAFDLHASAGGFFYLSDCKLVGATDWEAATVSGLTILDNPIGAVNGGLAQVQTA